MSRRAGLQERVVVDFGRLRFCTERLVGPGRGRQRQWRREQRGERRGRYRRRASRERRCGSRARQLGRADRRQRSPDRQREDRSGVRDTRRLRPRILLLPGRHDADHRVRRTVGELRVMPRGCMPCHLRLLLPAGQSVLEHFAVHRRREGHRLSTTAPGNVKGAVPLSAQARALKVLNNRYRTGTMENGRSVPGVTAGSRRSSRGLLRCHVTSGTRPRRDRKSSSPGRWDIPRPPSGVRHLARRARSLPCPARPGRTVSGAMLRRRAART
jgi:hypothetical protein